MQPVGHPAKPSSFACMRGHRCGPAVSNRFDCQLLPALEAQPAGAKIVLHTDSTYVKDGLTKWIINWKRNGWKNAAKEPVKNKDLWIRLEAAASTHKVDWRWVKGHSGHAENDRADALARLGCDENRVRR